ncbi:MAG: hypothetical protein AAGP08_04140 [Pseudomonadota bacterium]
MKKIFFAGVFALTTTAAVAGGMNKPVMEPVIVAPEIIIEKAEESSGSDEWVGVLLTFLAIVVVGIGG